MMIERDDGDEPSVPAGPDLLVVAARELIGAARRVLDAVEQVVDDPDAASGAGAVVSDIVRQAAQAGASLFAPKAGAPPAADDDDGGGGGVEFIKVD